MIIEVISEDVVLDTSSTSNNIVVDIESTSRDVEIGSTSTSGNIVLDIETVSNNVVLNNASNLNNVCVGVETTTTQIVDVSGPQGIQGIQGETGATGPEGPTTGDYVDGSPLIVVLADAGTSAVNKTYTYTASTSMGFISILYDAYNEPSLSSGKYTIITPDTKFKDFGGTTTIHSRESLDTDYVYVGQINASPFAFTSFIDYYKIRVTDFTLGNDSWVATGGAGPVPTTTYTFEQLLSYRLDNGGFYTNIGITVGDRTIGNGTIDTDTLNATNVNLLNLNATDGSFFFNPTVDEYPSGSGSRFIWDSTKSTLMAGTAYTDKWDYANVPSYSIIGGYSNSANSGAIVGGQGNTAGYNGASFGALTESSSHGLSSGSSTLASPYGFSAGYRTKGYGWANWVGGTGTIVEGDESFGFGGIHISGSDSIAGPYVTADRAYAFGFDFTNSVENSFMVGFSDINFYVSATETYIENKLGVGITPTAKLHILSGSATAGTAPLKLTSGALLTTPEDGVIEYLSNVFYIQNDGLTVSGDVTSNMIYTDGIEVEGQIMAESSAFPVMKTTRTTAAVGNGTINALIGIASGVQSRTQTSGDMTDGFGGGFVFSIGDDTVSDSVIARLYARRDTADDKGCLQVFIGQIGTKLAQTWRYNGFTGIGTSAPNSTFEVEGSVSKSYVAKTANYTLDEDDYQVECTANSFTITLPTASGITGRMYSIKNTGTGTITLDGDSSETIDGAATQAIAQWENIKVMSNNVNWIII